MRKVRTCRVYSVAGETHFILEEPQTSEHSKCFKNHDQDEIKKISRKEANKPLILFREE